MDQQELDKLSEEERKLYQKGHEDGYMKASAYYKGRRSHGRDLSPKDVAEILGEFVNGYSHKGKEVAESVMREHRTLQRNIFCLLLDIIEQFAETPMTAGHMDLRNQAVLEMSRAICQEGGGYYKGSRPPLI